MGTLITLGIIALALLLLGLVPLGVDLAYDGAFSVSVRAGFLSFRLGAGAGDGSKKRKKPKEEKKEAKETVPERDKKRGPPWQVVKILLKNGYTILCRLISRLRVELLRVHFTAAGGPDPAAGAVEYGAAAAAMDALAQLGKRRVRRADLRADVDFEAASPVIDFRIVLTLPLFRLVGAAVGFGAAFLIDYCKCRRQDRKRGA